MQCHSQIQWARHFPTMIYWTDCAVVIAAADIAVAEFDASFEISYFSLNSFICIIIS